MTDNTTKDSDILKYAIANCIIDFGSIRSQYEECERMNILDSYEYKIFESGGRWYCRLPDGRRIKRKNREDVEKEILKILKEIKKAEMDSGGKIPEEVFTEWNESRLNSGVIEGSTALRYRKHRSSRYWIKILRRYLPSPAWDRVWPLSSLQRLAILNVFLHRINCWHTLDCLQRHINPAS